MSTYKVKYRVDGGTWTAIDTESCNIATGETSSFTHNVLTAIPTTGQHTLEVVVSEPNGLTDNVTDNTLTLTLLVSDLPSGDAQPCPNASTVTDVDGHVYNTVKLGGQCWMASNLRTTRYADGTLIAQGSGNSTTTAYRYVPDNNEDYLPTYGYLYNWPAVMHGASGSSANPSGVQGVCPNGWHVPSNAEWNQLTNYLMNEGGYTCGSGGNSIAKALASTTSWNCSSVTCAIGNTPINNNSTGFDVYASGYYNGGTISMGVYSYLWSTTEYGDNVISRGFCSEYAFIPQITNTMKQMGHPVRCLRDAGSTSSLPTVSTNTVTSVTSSSASCGGNVTDNGGSAVTARGVCWSTSQNPTVSDSHTSDGSGIGSFNSSITGLSPNTTYYVRAYATNSAGTAYGNTLVFNTLCTGPITASADSAVCDFELPITWNGVVFTNPGDSTVILFAACGTDSVLTMHLTVNNGQIYSVADTICDSELPYIWNGITFNAAGTQTVTLNAANVCDSVVTMTLAVTSCTTGGGQPCPGTPTVTDHEGNVYATVQIGNQCWMRDNLRTTTSPSTGTYLIPAAGTGYTYTGKQAFWINNDSSTYAPMNYGLLYNWNAAVDTFNTAYGETSVNTDYNKAVSVTFTGHRRGICPAGWHLPSDAEWTQLTDYVSSQSEYTCGGNSSYIAKALASETGWYSYSGECYPGDQSVHANNATGFSSVPAGFCSGSSFYHAGYYADFWSSAQSVSYYAYYRNLLYTNARVSRLSDNKGHGYSVRCLRD